MPGQLHIAGLDLSGPANAADTVLTWFRPRGNGLEYDGHVNPASDSDIVQTLSTLG